MVKICVCWICVTLICDRKYLPVDEGERDV